MTALASLPAYSCEWDTDGDNQEPPLNCAKKRNCVELDGRYSCEGGMCSRIKSWKCQRRCSGIRARGKNVMVMSGERFLIANCRQLIFSQHSDLSQQISSPDIHNKECSSWSIIREH